MTRNFGEVILVHFFNKHVSKIIHSLKEISGKKAGKKEGRIKSIHVRFTGPACAMQILTDAIVFTLLK